MGKDQAAAGRGQREAKGQGRKRDKAGNAAKPRVCAAQALSPIRQNVSFCLVGVTTAFSALPICHF